MKSADQRLSNPLFGGIFSVIADSLGQTNHFLPSASAGAIDSRTSRTGGSGVFSRLGRWLLQRRIDGMAPEIARSMDAFDRIDQWLWRQQVRETESYLAKSTDIFDLERRLKALDRSPVVRII